MKVLRSANPFLNEMLNFFQVFVHPKSVNFQVNNFDSPYLVYHEKVKTSKVYIRDCSMVSMYALLLFCGDSLSLNLEKGVFVISIDDGWIRFSASSHQVCRTIDEIYLRKPHSYSRITPEISPCMTYPYNPTSEYRF